MCGKRRRDGFFRGIGVFQEGFESSPFVEYLMLVFNSFFFSREWGESSWTLGFWLDSRRLVFNDGMSGRRVVSQSGYVGSTGMLFGLLAGYKGFGSHGQGPGDRVFSVSFFFG